MQVTVMLIELAEGTKLLQCRIIENCSWLLPMRLIIMCHTKGWIMKLTVTSCVEKTMSIVQEMWNAYAGCI
jgi:hypothetical protein